MQSHSIQASNSRQHASRRRPGGLARLCIGLMLTIGLHGCASVHYDRHTETSGTFVTTGTAFTILTIDLPQRAIDIARENASDAGLPNMVIENVTIFPHLGPFDWILDLVSIRYARISGHWGFEE
ncbi:MAG: hypothetical protein ACI841_001737 [Planctomycetota bacterium]|jgi:hypothetical protein